ncbi:DUF483 domain-containing protein [Candidatus Woesearchaeota archaeon]|jgi:hypothetical protein|nr:DUF483 domain-containing protein [Candidatus Woesearchaeota archaeon]
MIKEMSLVFGSKTKAQEIVFLLEDVKEIVRQGFYEEELDKVEKFCKEKGLFLVRSKFKVLLADETGYSNKGIRISEEDKRPGMHFVYISKDEEKAWLASYYELVGNDYDLGLLLGYPKCCADFFVKNFSVERYDLELKASNLFTNLSKRNDDCVLLSHFPCSSDCEESLGLGKKFLSVIRSVDKERAEEMENLLIEQINVGEDH